MTTVQIKATVQWAFAVTKNRKYVGVCKALGMVIQGDSYSDFVLSATEGIDAMLKDLLSENQLTAFLRKRGWRARSPIPRQHGRMTFDVPMETRQVPLHDLQAVRA